MEALLYEIQRNYQKEIFAKHGKKFIPTHEEIITIQCETFYFNINDPRFSQLFQENPDKHYDSQLTNFCNFLPTLQLARDHDKILMEDVLLRTTNLLLLNVNYNSNLATRSKR